MGIRCGGRALLLTVCLIPLFFPAATTAQPPAQARDGQHDFDFEIGKWKTHLKRLTHPLTGSSTARLFLLTLGGKLDEVCSKLLELFLREVSTVKNHRRNGARVPDVFKRIAIEQDEVCQLARFDRAEIGTAMEEDSGIEGCRL